MSGEGVISVRLQRSLLTVFRSAAERQGLTIHDAAATTIAAINSGFEEELEELREPPREADSVRVSLYVGWYNIDALTAITRNRALTNSSILRRLLYGLLVTREIEFVQQNDRWNLQIAPKKRH
jgi:hypothetical protein